MDFSKLKKNSVNSLERLTQYTDNLQGKNYKDDRFWTPKVDNNGNGFAIIRLLPQFDIDEPPFAQFFEHGFKGPSGHWYIEKSLTSIGKPDPVANYNTKLWNSTSDDDAPARKQARRQKRKLRIVSNVYIVQDPAQPEMEGKVMLFQYGKKLFNKFNDVTKKEFPDDKPFDPFNPWTGANFVLKITKVEGYRNYDKSKFEAPSPLFNDDKKLKEVLDRVYPLKEFNDPSSFKSFDELQEKLNRVLELNGATPVRSRARQHDETNEENESPPWDDDNVANASDDAEDNESYYERLIQS